MRNSTVVAGASREASAQLALAGGRGSLSAGRRAGFRGRARDALGRSAEPVALSRRPLPQDIDRTSAPDRRGPGNGEPRCHLGGPGSLRAIEHSARRRQRPRSIAPLLARWQREPTQCMDRRAPPRCGVSPAELLFPSPTRKRAMIAQRLARSLHDLGNVWVMTSGTPA